MEIKGSLLFIAILLATSVFAAGAEQAGTPAPDATAAIRALLAEPDFAAATTPAENAYDFASQDGVPGFGPLDPADNDRRVAGLVGR